MIDPHDVIALSAASVVAAPSAVRMECGAVTCARSALSGEAALP
jgi:hypothetical protein